MIAAYDVQINFRNPQAALQLHNQDGGMVFAHEDDEDSQHEQSMTGLSLGHGRRSSHGQGTGGGHGGHDHI